MKLKVLFIFCTAFMSSCSLDEDPLSLITPDEFFHEDRDAQSSIDAIYTYINGGASIYARYFWLVNAMASDLGRYRGTDPDLAEFASMSVTPQNSILLEIWQGLYAGINAANFAIENIPSVPISDMEKDVFIAEARFLRAIFYFDLMRLFGGVPLLEQANTVVGSQYLAERKSLEETAQFVELEFTHAFENLPESNSPGRPVGLTAAAYLSRFYLTRGEFNKAFQASRAVIQSGRWSLASDYAMIFSGQPQNKSEELFSISIDLNGANPVNAFTLPLGVDGLGHILPTSFYVDGFEFLDRRRQVSFFTSYISDEGVELEVEPHVGKYWQSDLQPIGSPSAIDIPIFRFSDLLLLHCEAINELRNGTNAEALQAINMVRARARFNGVSNEEVLPDLTRMGKEEFKDAILQERSKELGWEGHRWFDLVRTGRLKETVEKAKPDVVVEDKYNVFPIPQREFTLNPNLGSQNPGY
ncbi:MAG: RagB/SusD family nutrient uptake outer membrane protein [Saprospiraceae bacterium]|nr:RagB/SusD family nutrient uptake outer membrane protein [Saprospiraceae bacterium]